MNAAEQIAAFVCGYRPQDLDARLLHACSRSLLDTYAVAVAGAGEPASIAARRYAATAFGNPAAGGARLWGDAGMVPAETAALCNGIAAHVLDYDDVTAALRGHASVALWPALSALAEAEDIDSGRLASAYVVGFEVLCKLAHAMAVEHYAKGWHTTASIGVLGGAAACAHLLGLDVRQTINALGLAVAQAGGIRENVGTQAKSFQAGQCNAAALRSALLAREGFEASADALDGPFGYFRLYGSAANAPALLAALGNAPLELERSGLDVKKYPMCYATHRALDGLLFLKHRYGIDAAQVESVRISASAGALIPLVHPHPATGLEGKFSMQYAVAAALLDGAVRLASFTDAAVRRPEAVGLMSRTSVVEAGGSMFPKWAQVEIALRSGQTLTRRVELLRGSKQAPLTDAELQEKLADCLRWAGSTDSAPRLWRTAQMLGHASSRNLFDELRLRNPLGVLGESPACACTHGNNYMETEGK